MEFITLIKPLTEFGITGIIMSITLFVAFKLWLEVKAGWEVRIEETKRVIEAINAASTSYEALAKTSEDRVRATETIAQTQQQLAQSLLVQHEVLKVIKEKIDELDRDRRAFKHGEH